MQTGKKLLWILPIFSAILLIQSKMEPHKPSLELTHQTLQKHTWISVDEEGQSAGKGQQTRKIIFSGQGRFEIQETFEFSGSTFKNPGKYTLRDSIILLKTFKSEVQIGQISLQNGHQLRVDWKGTKNYHGKGVEIYKMHPSSASEQKQTFSSRVFQAFHPE